MIQWAKSILEYRPMSLVARFRRTIHSVPIQILLALFCLFCWWVYLPENRLRMLVGAVVSFGLVRQTLPALRCVRWRADRAILLASAGLGALFCLMMPVSWFYQNHLVYESLKQQRVPDSVGVVIDFAANTAGLLFAIGVVFLLILKVWLWLRQAHWTPLSPIRDWKSNLRTGLLYALPGLLIWLLFLYAYWPGILSPDSYDTWLQLSGYGFNDWVPVSFSLLAWLLTRLWYTPAMICLFQIGMMAAAWGMSMAFFENRGLPRRLLFPLSIVFALIPNNPILLITVWKDILYAIVNFVLVFLLGLIWLSQGEWLQRRRNAILLGVVLALPYLFRHNGVLILGLVPLALLVFYWKRWKPILSSAALAVVIVIVLRNGLIFGLLNAGRNPDSVMYVVPIQHISAVVHETGSPYSEAQKEVLERIAPVSAWRKAYNPYDADKLSKTWGVMKDSHVFDKIHANKSELMAIFLDFTLRYPMIVLKSELNLTSLVWEFTTSDLYLQNKLDFFFRSTPVPPPLDPALFKHPNLDSPLTRTLDFYLRLSNTEPFFYMLFWKGGLYLFLTLLFTMLYRLLHGRTYLLLAVPMLANVASLAVSMPVQNFRYVYPVMICSILIALFGLVKMKQD